MYSVVPCVVHTLAVRHTLQEYMCYYRDWGPIPDPLKALCPIDHSKKEEENTENGACADSPLNNESSFVEAVDMNGQRILVYNFNGITFQVLISHLKIKNEVFSLGTI